LVDHVPTKRPFLTLLLKPKLLFMMRSNTSYLILTFLLVVLGASDGVAAQVVRGTVTERETGAPLPGVVVSLESTAPDATPISVLSDPQGAYAIRGPAGAYRVTAKRIGVQRYFSEEFALGPGETRPLDIVMDRVVFELPAVRVVESGLCITRGEDRQRVLSLWDEARTALTATALSRRDKLFDGSITRYKRSLDPRSLRVLEDAWGELSGTLEGTFNSPDGETLSRTGYWRQQGNDALYWAPDGDVLLSRAFQRDHCFGVAQTRGDRAGLVGLSFAPAPERTMAEVQGVLWMDERTFALEFVEFTYTGLPEAQFNERVGGELHFSRLASGAWVISRWFLRMPEYVAETDTRAPVLMTRATIRTIVEEGGLAFGPGLRLFTTPASIAGTMSDSAGRPFPQVAVRLAGTPFNTTTNEQGEFRLDSLPPGSFVLIAQHPGYTSIGMAAADERIDLKEGTTTRSTLRAASTAQLMDRLCPSARQRGDRAVVRLVATDTSGLRPQANMAVWLRWAGDFVGRQELIASNRGGLETRTSEDGLAVFCDVPANMTLTISAVNALGRPSADSILVRAASGKITPAHLRTRRP
jgi:hypothetical protein